MKTPTLSDVRNAGYVVDIVHLRRFDVVYVQNNKIVNKTVERAVKPSTPQQREDIWLRSLEVLNAKGGTTQLTVNDPKTGVDFYAESRCSVDDNYDKGVGIQKCLERVTGLMVVCDGTEGFKMALEV